MENKPYSIKNKNVKSRKSKREIDKVYKKISHTKLYLGALSTFVVLTIVIVFSPLVTGKSYEYNTVKLDDPINVVASLNLTVTEMEINKENGLFKVTFSYFDETNQKSLSNLQYDYKLNYITNKGKTNTKQSIVKVEDNYNVVYFENLPKDFGVISMTIIPRYIYPELESTNDLETKEIKVYAVDEDIKVNNKLKIQNEYQLKVQNFEYQIKTIEEQIANENSNIEQYQTGIKIKKQDIEKLENEIAFQTSAEQVQTQTEISSKISQIETTNGQINESNEKIKELKKKIIKVNENKQVYK
ncbi:MULTISPECIES: hypothetical protein [Vagococcus]|uniref:Replication-associated protein n=1 Tax=Vagococcus fluvialis bH819 TaxID=1255619 RepID=A0A1X6WS15_9ENTE|nr:MULTISPECIES: hypothetical protein [Vagococcus]SLM87074.1 replication-associated protein [Vagococcus fluvialis bH819]HCM90579.1 hypothetical protein [Vagococcus sp.]